MCESVNTHLTAALVNIRNGRKFFVFGYISGHGAFHFSYNLHYGCTIGDNNFWTKPNGMIRHRSTHCELVKLLLFFLFYRLSCVFKRKKITHGFSGIVSIDLIYLEPFSYAIKILDNVSWLMRHFFPARLCLSRLEIANLLIFFLLHKTKKKKMEFLST